MDFSTQSFNLAGLGFNDLTLTGDHVLKEQIRVGLLRLASDGLALVNQGCNQLSSLVESVVCILEQDGFHADWSRNMHVFVVKKLGVHEQDVLLSVLLKNVE